MTAKPAQKRSLGPAPLLYPEPALLVATYDAEGKPNCMTAAWAGICASDPVSLMVAIQPPRHTHDALLEPVLSTLTVIDGKWSLVWYRLFLGNSNLVRHVRPISTEFPVKLCRFSSRFPFRSSRPGFLADENRTESSADEDAT